MQTFLSTLAGILLTALMLTFAPYTNNIKAHECKFDDCEMKGDYFFSSQYEEDTDGYLMDYTHFNNPGWDGETIEEYIFHVGK